MKSRPRKPFKFSIAILLLVSAVLTILNLTVFVLHQRPASDQEIAKMHSDLEDRVYALERIAKKNKTKKNTILEPHFPSDSNSKISELDDRVAKLHMEVERLASLSRFATQHQAGDSYSLDPTKSSVTIEERFEIESGKTEPQHQLLLIQSSINDSFYRDHLHGVELIDVICKSRSCRVDLSLLDTISPDAALEKILGSINQDVDFQISEHDGEMKLFFTLPDSL